jgi:hypothetical protein
MFVGVDGRHRVNGEAERNNHRIQLVLLQLGTAFAQRYCAAYSRLLSERVRGRIAQCRLDKAGQLQNHI